MGWSEKIETGGSQRTVAGSYHGPRAGKDESLSVR